MPVDAVYTPSNPSTIGLYLGLGLAVVTLIQVLLMTIINGVMAARKEKRDAQIKSEEKAEDWRRQDIVADRVAETSKKASEVAHLLLKTQLDTNARTDEVARLAAETDKRVQAQLQSLDEQGKKIHILVNSDMTAARTNEREQTKLLLIALRRVKALGLKLGIASSDVEDKAIIDAEERILYLDTILADRHAAQVLIDSETEKEKE